MRILHNADDLARWFKPGMEVFVAGCLGESPLFIEWLKSRPDLAQNVRFTGVFIPGVNRFDYAQLHPSARMRTIFASSDWGGEGTAARHECLPLAYRDAFAWLTRQRFDVVLVQGAPYHQGLNLSVAADFTPAVLARASAVLVHRNAQLPVTDAPVIASPDGIVDADVALAEYDAGPLNDALRMTAQMIAPRIRPRSTVQLGLGKMQAALLDALPAGHNLRLHSGMVSTPLVAALARGVFALDTDALTCGVALGERSLLASSERFAFRSVDYTHDPRTLAAIPKFVSVNSVLEVDLQGQANAEYVDGRAVSGCGGLVDFVRGARLSGGTSILALSATARGGALSRIVPRLASPTVSVSRHDVDVVVTEYGIAELTGTAGDERAERLIAIAAPGHRESLRAAWRAKG